MAYSYVETGKLNLASSDLYDNCIKLHYIDNNLWAKQTDFTCKNVYNIGTAVNLVL